VLHHREGQLLGSLQASHLPTWSPSKWQAVLLSRDAAGPRDHQVSAVMHPPPRGMNARVDAVKPLVPPRPV
jgi:hypothetical protein